MTKTRDNYQITATTVPELVRTLNFLLQRFADRIDKIEGIRGTASIESDLDMNDNLVTEVGGGSLDDDAARLADLTVDITAAITAHKAAAETISGAWTFSAEAAFTNDIKVYDAAGNLIHSLE